MHQKTIINYSADYSAGFTDRSLVDKAFVDNAIASLAGLAVLPFIVPLADLTTFNVPALIGKTILLAIRGITFCTVVTDPPANGNQINFDTITGDVVVWENATTDAGELIIFLYA